MEKIYGNSGNGIEKCLSESIIDSISDCNIPYRDSMLSDEIRRDYPLPHKVNVEGEKEYAEDDYLRIDYLNKWGVNIPVEWSVSIENIDNIEHNFHKEIVIATKIMEVLADLFSDIVYNENYSYVMKSKGEILLDSEIKINQLIQKYIRTDESDDENHIKVDYDEFRSIFDVVLGSFINN